MLSLPAAIEAAVHAEVANGLIVRHGRDRVDFFTSTTQELDDALVDHFSSVFAVPPLPLAPDPPLPDPPSMLLRKDSVDPQWYEGLLAAITEQELLSVLSDVPLVSSPGQDVVWALVQW